VEGPVSTRYSTSLLLAIVPEYQHTVASQALVRGAGAFPGGRGVGTGGVRVVGGDRGCRWLLGHQLVQLGGGNGFTLTLLWSGCSTGPFGNRALVSLHSFVGCKLASTCLALPLWEAFFGFFCCLLVLPP
jgi:hypothetical protein